MAARARGLVDGQGLALADVRKPECHVDVALAHGHHPMRRLADDAGHGGEWHLLGQHQDQLLEQQREARQPSGELRLAKRTAPSGSFTRGVRTCRWHSCWKKFMCR